MRAAYIVLGSKKVKLKEVEIPEINESEILAKTRCVGVCETDLERMYSKSITPPMFGHEVIGK